MWELAKSKRIWVASLCASAYATIPFVLFPAYFVLIIFAIRSAQEHAISYFDAPLYGAQLALRVLSAIALAGALHLDFSSVLSDCEVTAAFAIQAREAFDPCLQANVDLTNLVRILVCCSLAWVWIKHDRRPLTAPHFGSAAVVSFAALMLNAALTPKPGSLTDGWPPPLVWDRLGLTSLFVSYAEITLQVLIVAGLGFLLGHLCAPCFGQPNPLPKRILFSFKPRANWFRADKLTWQQILAGFLAAKALTVLFTAKNSALYSEYPLDWRYAYNDDLIGRFNYDALRTGLSGLFEVLPYIAAGAIIVWVLGKVRLAGILPILVVGAIMGRIAGVMIQPQYQTPFLTPLDGATLIGMIVAAGFGAAANAIGLRTSHHKIDTTGNQPI
ncbi:MAG: hypothetical protein ACK5XZ_01440 [Hyphomonadaceae bacterium]|jgi:hypothetical protein